jgi:ERCC4-type nuclease
MLFFIYRSIELLRKARDELAHHHSQLVQISHKYERSVFKNSKLEDSVSATKRELEEFKRKDAENAKAIKQVIPFCPGSGRVVASHGVC